MHENTPCKLKKGGWVTNRTLSEKTSEKKKKIVLNLYSIVLRVRSYLSLWVGERAWQRGCIKQRERENRKQPRCKKKLAVSKPSKCQAWVQCLTGG